MVPCKNNLSIHEDSITCYIARLLLPLIYPSRAAQCERLEKLKFFVVCRPLFPIAKHVGKICAHSSSRLKVFCPYLSIDLFWVSHHFWRCPYNFYTWNSRNSERDPSFQYGGTAFVQTKLYAAVSLLGESYYFMFKSGRAASSGRAPLKEGLMCMSVIVSWKMLS